jgi:hypothetical protein
VIRSSYTPRSAITHRVNVRRYAARKRSALAAHCSGAQKGKGRAAGMHRAMLALPAPVFGLFFGREWFVEPGAATAAIRTGILQAAAPDPRHTKTP